MLINKNIGHNIFNLKTMRKIKHCLIITLSFLINVQALCQTTDTLRYKSFLFEFGGGITISKRNVDTEQSNAFDENYGIGFMFELLIHYPFNKYSEISSGVNFIQNNFNFSSNDPLGDYSLKEKINSLNVPIFFTFEVPSKKIIPYLDLGMNYSRMLSTNAEYEDSNGTIVTSFKGQRNANNLYARFGVGMKIKWINDLVNIGIDYNLGLTNLDKEIQIDPNTLLWENSYQSNDFRLNYFSFSIGYVPNIYKR